MRRDANLLLVLLLGAVLISAIGVSYAKYQSRKLFGELEGLRAQRDELAVDWGRLQLELATWAAQERIEVEARDKLGMRMPGAQDVVVIRP